MGYTLYWYRDKLIDQLKFDAILNDFGKILQEFDRNQIVLAGPDGDGPPKINEYGISFNGHCTSQGCCEAFTFLQELIFVYREPRQRNGKNLQYVKTDGLPYGLAAATFLIIAKHILKDQIIVSSDKPLSNWDKPREWCKSVLGYGSEFLPENDSSE
jgi:hypothetical protein